MSSKNNNFLDAWSHIDPETIVTKDYLDKKLDLHLKEFERYNGILLEDFKHYMQVLGEQIGANTEKLTNHESRMYRLESSR